MAGNPRLIIASLLAAALVVGAVVVALAPGDGSSDTATPLAAPTSSLTVPPTTSPPAASGPAIRDVAGAESTVSIRGRVVWATGGGTRDAVVTVSQTATGQSAIATTDRSGTYDVPIPAEWAQGEMQLTATAPAPSGASRGPSTTRRVRPSDPATAAPLVLWSGTFSLNDGLATWDPAPVGGIPVMSFTFGDAELLTVTGTSTQASFEPILLEDHTAGVSASITTDAGERYSTSVIPITGPGEPVSRRGPCFFTSDNGVTRVPAPTCQLTDGDFANADERGASSRDVIIDLGARTPITTVVVRGYPSTLRIEVSTDGGVWHPFAEGPGATSAAIFEPGSNAVARYVRVLGDEVTYFATREISVW